MKNRASALVRVRHLFYALVAVFILQSCGYDTPIIDGKYPFIVSSIEQWSETHSIYVNDNFQGDYAIVLPSRMYQIGDTIRSGFKINE